MREFLRIKLTISRIVFKEETQEQLTEFEYAALTPLAMKRPFGEIVQT